ncbi:MAG TPA: hypothetical protein VIC70_05455 [Gaiellaceae bacterium]
MATKRFSAVTLALAALVFGGAVLAGNSRASSGAQVSYICSAVDQQFIQTVSTNMVQLGYWSDALQSHDVDPSVVVNQARSEAGQISATDPEDRTLHATRDLLVSMFLEYGKAVAQTAKGHDATQHMQNAWRLANSSHKLLIGAKAGLAAQGCDISPLLATSN